MSKGSVIGQHSIEGGIKCQSDCQQNTNKVFREPKAQDECVIQGKQIVAVSKKCTVFELESNIVCYTGEVFNRKDWDSLLVIVFFNWEVAKTFLYFTPAVPFTRIPSQLPPQYHSYYFNMLFLTCGLFILWSEHNRTLWEHRADL
jgi:hypothetical protein